MSCPTPIRAYRAYEQGIVTITFNDNNDNIIGEIPLPCGKCLNCKLAKSRENAVRCVHEASLYDSNTFITFTFSPANVKPTLVKSDFVDFMKRFRKIHPATDTGRTDQFGDKIYLNKKTFYHCGEYGERFSRPHHHALLFNHRFDDLQFHKKSYSGQPIYISKTLDKIWGLGHCYIGNVTFKSAAYVARYTTKKIYADDDTRELYYSGRLPEYVSSSRCPAIGREWFKRYYTDVFPHDHVIVPGLNIKLSPPRYYYKLLEKYSEILPDKFKGIYEQVKLDREEKFYDPVDDKIKLNDYKAKVHKFKNSKRGYEDTDHLGLHHDLRSIEYYDRMINYS